MSYILKDGLKEELTKRYKGKYLAEQLGRTQSYISLLINRKITCPKPVAYTFVKLINSSYEIEDLFERV